MKSKIIVLTGCLFAAVVVQASVVSKKIETLTQNLIKSAQSRFDYKSPPVLAVMPLNANKSLTQKRIGFAFSELITHNVVKGGEYNVVERTQLNQVMQEQKLQQTGAIDSESATELGKLLGAALMVVGSVEKVGNNYQVNTRMVDVQTAEVMSTAFTEIPAKEFEQEARPYLDMLPYRQRIGFYALYNMGFETKVSEPVTFNNDGFYTVTYTPEESYVGMWGGGIKYFLTQKIYLDAALAGQGNQVAGNSVNQYGSRGITEVNIRMGRGLLGIQIPFTRWFRGDIGIGAARYTAKFQSNLHFNYSEEIKENLPYVRAGFEIRPQERLGMGVNFNYAFGDLEIKSRDLNNRVVVEFENYSIEPNISLYF